MTPSDSGCTMDIDRINDVLRQEQLAPMVVQSYDAGSRNLVIAFMCEGGPREDDAFAVEFHETIIFHLPAILHRMALFRRAGAAERERLIPRVSYDSAEVSGAPGAYTVVALDDDNGSPLGYYVAAESASAAWRSRRELRGPWALPPNPGD
jgi:hypothetical protein